MTATSWQPHEHTENQDSNTGSRVKPEQSYTKQDDTWKVLSMAPGNKPLRKKLLVPQN